MPTNRLDRLFGGKPGAAENTRQNMRKTYGRAEGDKVFEATVIKRQRRAKIGGHPRGKR